MPTVAAVERRLLNLDIVTLMSQLLLAQSRGQVTLPSESHLRWLAPNGGQARSLAMHALIEEPKKIAGVKIINANPANIQTGLERASGLTLLFDIETGQIRAVVPAAPISAARTAAVSTVAIDHCRSASAERLAFVGCGPIARWHARLLTRGGRACTQIAAFDVREDRASEFAAYCRDLGFPCKLARTARAAVTGADVLIAATTTIIPYIELDWLKPGAVVVNVSLDDLAANVLLGCDRLFVDDWDLIIEDQHRLLGRLAREQRVCGPGHTRDGARPVDGTIADVVAGRARGRAADSEIVVVNPFGMAAADIVLADSIVSEGLDD